MINGRTASGYSWMLKEAELTFGEDKPQLLPICAAENNEAVSANPANYAKIFSEWLFQFLRRYYTK